jgi:hypothetical protein
MDRRRFLLTSLAGVLAVPLAAEAQPTGRVYRIAYLGNSSAALEAELVAPFRDGLRDLNYVESRNVVIHYLWAEGHYDRFPALVSEAVQLKVDVIVTAGTPAVLAAKGGHANDPHRCSRDGRSYRRRSEPRAAGRQHYGLGFHEPRDRREAAAAAEGNGARGHPHRRVVESRESEQRRPDHAPWPGRFASR